METNKSLSTVVAGFLADTATIKEALRSAEPEVRGAALGASLRAQLLTSDVLRPFLTDESPEVRYRAVELCPRVPDAQRLVADVTQLLAQPDLAEVAAFVLGELGDVNPQTRSALCAQAEGHADPLCRESAVAALGALAVGKETVLKATKDIATVRRRAVLCLAAFEGDDVDKALQIALQDRDWQVRQAAEDLLAITPEETPD